MLGDRKRPKQARARELGGTLGAGIKGPSPSLEASFLMEALRVEWGPNPYCRGLNNYQYCFADMKSDGGST